MIVSSAANGWDVVFQPAHGLLAADLARRLNAEWQSSFWFETLIAIATHDDSKVAFRSNERTYLTEAGAPQNFDQVKMTSEQRYQEVRSRLENAYRKHRWIGLLESTHADFLFGSTDVSNELRQLLEDETDRRRRTLKELDKTAEDLGAAYHVMRWCDRLSLILCGRRIPEMNRRLEIVTAAGQPRSEIFRHEDDSLGITPWPFNEQEFTVTVEAHPLNELSFDDDQQLEQALKEATTKQWRWNFRKP